MSPVFSLFVYSQEKYVVSGTFSEKQYSLPKFNTMYNKLVRFIVFFGFLFLT